MRKTFTLLLISAALFTACSSDSDGDNAPVNNANPCANAASFTVNQVNESVEVNVTASSSPLYYEISVLQPGSSNPENGQKETFTGTHASIAISDLIFSGPGTYLFYLRTACSETGRSDWSSAVSVTINEYCMMPYDLGYYGNFPTGISFKWSGRSDNTYYQVEYGEQGFMLGTGTSVNIGNNEGTQYDGMSLLANHTYDFYVRAYCNSASGWSSWAGPYTYFASENQNICASPTNVTYSIVQNGSGQPIGANFQWNLNGETNFYYELRTAASLVTSGTIGTAGTPTIIGLSQGVTYYFYVRANCSGGAQTELVGPLSFNL